MGTGTCGISAVGLSVRGFLLSSSVPARCVSPSGLDLVLASDLISDEFRSGPHKALLFSGVVNVDRGESHARDMTSGQHTIQSIFCKQCQTELGWTYVKAADACNRYKEGNFILVVPDIVSHPHRGGCIDADTAAAAAARKRRRSTSNAAAAAAAAAGASELASSAAAAASNSASPSIPFATLSRSRYTALGSRSASLSSASSAASDGTPPSGSQSSSRSRSSSSSMIEDDEEAEGDASAPPPGSTSALLARLRALRRILGPPHAIASGPVHHSPPPLLPDPHLSPDSPQQQQQAIPLPARLLRGTQLAFFMGRHSPPPSV